MTGKVTKLAIVAATVLLAAASPAFAAEAEPHLDGAALSPLWAIPFAGVLVSIAIGPLVAPHFWHHNYGKVVAFWAASFLAPFAYFFGFELAHYEFLHVILMEYLPFVVILFALYVVSGGIFVEGHIRGTPAVNTAILAGGTAIASITGTTGASVLLIRPLLRANEGRRSAVHVVVFFIFLVSNIGGSLTPLGDPPLYIGFLKGVDFFWTAQHIWRETLLMSLLLLTAFYIIDTVAYDRDPGPTNHAPTKIKIKGVINIALLLAIVGVILASALWKTDVTVVIGGVTVDFQSVARTIALLGIASLSLMFTPVSYRAGNAFTWGPIVEVAKLFAAIFVTIVPVIAMLRAGTGGPLGEVVKLVTGPAGEPINAMYFVVTGALSSFLDNAPTYLVFFNVAGGDPQQLMGPLADTLAAISAGAVFWGAMTYVGNAPNFMVKAIAEEHGVKMPSFFGYMLWSCMLLLPSFALVTYLFFR